MTSYQFDSCYTNCFQIAGNQRHVKLPNISVQYFIKVTLFNSKN